MNPARFVQDKVNPPGSRTFSIDTKGEITCLAANKEFSHVACAGRQVFKVYSIEEDRFTERFNLRPGTAQKTGLNYVAVDIVWSPRDENVLASASSNGSIVFWDLNKTTKNKQDHVSHLHARAASRLCFHSQEPLLLSGGKDGKCQLFDTRRREVVNSFSSVSVHDVQWWPGQYFMFASATENGSVQIWDYRYPQSCLLEFPAHSGPVFALDFHPEDKSKLASAGRDKLIKVWNLPLAPLAGGQNAVSQPYFVQTIAPVSRIKWRPKRATQIASVVNSFDLGINVWELARPSIPLATFTEHKDVVTSIIWKDHHEFISGGKDSRLVMHSFKDAVRLCDKANPIALTLSKGDQIALAINDKLQLSANIAGKNASTPTGSQATPSASGAKVNVIQNLFRQGTSKPDKREIFIKDKISSLFFFEPQKEHEFDPEWFKYCARNYNLHGKSFEEMCQHNSDVAKRYQQIQIMKHWTLLKILFSSCFDPPTFHAANLAHSMTKSEPPVGLLSRPEVNGNTGDQIHHTENGDFTSGLSGDEDSDEHFPNPSMAQTTSHDFFYEDNEIDGFEFDMDDKDEELFEDEQEFILPAESFMPSHDLTDTADPHNAHAYHSHHQPIFNPDSSYLRDKHSEQRSPEKISVIPAAFDVPLWDSVGSVVSILRSYANAGDVQTAVTMYIVLGNKIKSQIDEELLESWMTAYIDLLEMFELWCESNTIITRCNVKLITQMNQASTTVYTVCALCHKSLLGGQYGWYCKKCQKITSLCSICHTPVKGIFVWCQGCAHGGHISHMKDWFASNKQCPTGCGHECEWT